MRSNMTSGNAPYIPHHQTLARVTPSSHFLPSTLTPNHQSPSNRTPSLPKSRIPNPSRTMTPATPVPHNISDRNTAQLVEG